MNVNSKPWRAIIENSCQSVADLCATLPRFAHLAEPLLRSKPTCYDRVCALVRRRSDDFNVLCHGDMWSNNLMFSASGADVLLCDFQIMTYASPVLDLLYLLYSSSGDDVTQADWTDCIGHYHQTLQRTLQELRYPHRWPTLNELSDEMVRRGFSCALNSLMVVGIRNLNVVSADVVKHCHSDSEESRRFRLVMLSNAACRSYVEMLLGYFERMGFISGQLIKENNI